MEDNENQAEGNYQLAMDKLVSLSERMLALAKAGEWQQLTELESKRRPLLEAFFSAWNNESADPQGVAAVRSFIKSLQTLDGEILGLAKQGKEQTADELSQLRKGREAASSYLKNL